MAEHLMCDMREKCDLDFDLVQTTRAFTFGDGQRKSSMGSMIGDIFLGGDRQTIEISVMDDDLPLLIGMDALGPECASALIDCGNGFLVPPKISFHIFQCRRLPSGHLAINVASPMWWQKLPLSLQNIVENPIRDALEDVSEWPATAAAAETDVPLGLTVGAAAPASS